ncbi:methyltransferase domain protein [Clostridium argentinense CDC 2741]|uniref:protein-glutamate O-methyltransferase n=1 Tax=Clostridium argentinense CDC 2741 TaxID=1418104 RepID=A0A0C1UI93_9CLOT|nr:protein-glutamate O-methyltransferase CheR [Clostridium argentinense]ARC85346.1 chemotaxis protein CheR [Clostridium argentinense]KIE47065.1 methyltransferase domain protein [Clostridium argentinense CDC 2741]NFF41487.1 protein-glutamate O-methyltransferase CheR [Clostridium argentinense]NFP52049.1 protein-glutamate O-methyltransferase CheR [Clostridium argentinense]NFP73515.1 protein-glutamate O-methyltransferase CheR [Clostridium argentinense]
MDFKPLEQWVLRELGIDLTAYKSNQLQRRISSLMSRVGVNTIEEYIRVLKTDLTQRQKFIDYLTINVTEFFRNPEIFDEFEKVIKKYLDYKNPLKIWSAACSIGAEPYSLAMMLNESTPSVNHKIIATDIDNTILDKAKKGEYSEQEVKTIPKTLMNKYFQKEGNNYLINNNIKRMVSFKRHDLILDNYDGNFDVIVCRNVVIYFNQDVKDKIYDKFSKSLKKGGILFVGATESIYNYKAFDFEKVSTFIYRKL